MLARLHKIRIWNGLAAAAFLVGGAAAPGVAGPLDRRQVDAEAKWLIHLDVEAMMASSYGPSLHEMIESVVELEGEKAPPFEQAGIDLLREIKGTTIYGRELAGRRVVAIFHASEAIEKLAELFVAEVPGFERLEGHERPTYSWEEKGEPRFARINPGPERGERLVVVASDMEHLAHAEALALRAAPPAASLDGAKPEGAMARRPRDGSMLFVAVAGLEHHPEGKGPRAALSRLTSALAIDLGESGPDSFADIALIARKEREADAMIQILNGVVAIGQMKIHSEPGYERYIGMLDDVVMAREGTTVNARISIPTARLRELVSELSSLEWMCGSEPDSEPAAPAKDPEER